MRLNRKGFSSGLMLVVIMLAVVIIALLFITQMGAFGIGKTPEAAQTPDPVEQAREVVDAINERIEQQSTGMEEDP